jgi:triosephosphate isomerase
MGRKLVAGNWKMFTTAEEAAELARGLRAALADGAAADVVVFPPFTSIAAARDALRGSDVGVGGQDLHAQAKGAFTGNVSGPMLRALGCTAVLVGHSERRQYEKEGGAVLAAKVRAALRDGLLCVFCCGEVLAEREAHRTDEVVRAQIDEALGELVATELARIVIAYEPVWAIGTGRVATTDQAQAAHAAIRAHVGLRWDAGTARAMRILYGGSVKPDNARALMSLPDVDGVLVGGASLDAAGFAAIVRAAG